MIIRARLIVKGRAQKAGYRDFVDEIAYNLNLKGYAKNLSDRTVEIVCEGRKEDIVKFADKIKIKEYPIRVDEVDVTYSEATGEFKDFDIIREEDITEATYERMDTAARYMRELGKDLGEKIETTGDKIEKVGTKVEGVGEKVEVMRKDTNRNFDAMARRYDLISKGLTQAIKMMKDEFTKSRKETRDEFKKSREESAKAYNNLARAINNLTTTLRISTKKK